MRSGAGTGECRARACARVGLDLGQGPAAIAHECKASSKFGVQ